MPVPSTSYNNYLVYQTEYGSTPTPLLVGAYTDIEMSAVDYKIEATAQMLPNLSWPTHVFRGWGQGDNLLSAGDLIEFGGLGDSTQYDIEDSAYRVAVLTAIWEEKDYTYVDESSGAYKPRLQNNNVDLEKILDMILALGLVDDVPVTLITFTINGIELQAEEGMTWNEWVESEYNTENYIQSGSYVAGLVRGTVSTSDSTRDNVLLTDVIIDNASYYVAFVGGG